MKRGNYYRLTIRTSGLRTPWSRHPIDYYGNVAGNENRDFNTLDELKQFLIDRYGAIPKSRHKIRGENGKPYGIILKHWVEESPNVYDVRVTPMQFYKIEQIYIDHIVYDETPIVL